MKFLFTLEPNEHLTFHRRLLVCWQFHCVLLGVSNMKVTNSNLELVIVNMKAMKIWKGKRIKTLKKRNWFSPNMCIGM